MALVVNHPVFGRGSFETKDDSASVAAGAVADLIPGDGARVRLILVATFAAAVDPETEATISDQTDGVTGAICGLTPTLPFAVLEYEKYGDVIQRPLRVAGAAAGLVVKARSVRFVKAEQ